MDFPITDVLQMIGRAGRPQFDTSAVAILFVHDIKKEYYKKFLYEPFPVESHLLEVFPDHLNAEIMAGTVQSKHEAMEYLSSTYLYHRIIKNPSYYGVDLSEVGHLEDALRSELAVNTVVIKFLSAFIDKCVTILEEDFCVRSIDAKLVSESTEEGPAGELSPEGSQQLISTPLGKICAYYYLSHGTVRLFQDALGPLESDYDQLQVPYLSQREILDLLTQATEYAPLPVRHNEEFLNEDLAKRCPIKLQRRSMESPHTKANLLLQAHCSRLALPIVDYYSDLKTVLDQAIRILQSLVDISAINGSLPTTLNIIQLQQCILQASWQHGNQLVMLTETENTPEVYVDTNLNDASQYYDDMQARNDSMLADLSRVPASLASLPFLLQTVHCNGSIALRNLRNLFAPYHLHSRIIDKLYKSLLQLPLIQLEELYLTEADSSEAGDPQKLSISKETIFHSAKETTWLTLKPNTEYLLQCRFRKKATPGQGAARSRNQKAFCPRFHKPKSESWYLVLGLQERSELVTMCRVPLIHSAHCSHQALRFRTPSGPSKKGPTGPELRLLYSLYLLSDCYIGLDQQYSIPLAIQSG